MSEDSRPAAQGPAGLLLCAARQHRRRRAGEEHGVTEKKQGADRDSDGGTSRVERPPGEGVNEDSAERPGREHAPRAGTAVRDGVEDSRAGL